MPQDVDKVRTFDTGATRSSDEGRPDYEGYLSPAVIERFGEYMTKHRKQADGGTRASDNWQRGIPKDTYMKSAWRHFMEWWACHRAVHSADADTLEDTLCAMLFNVQGYLHEHLKNRPLRVFPGNWPGEGFLEGSTIPVLANKEKAPEEPSPQGAHHSTYIPDEVRHSTNQCLACFRPLYRHSIRLLPDGGFTRSCEFV